MEKNRLNYWYGFACVIAWAVGLGAYSGHAAQADPLMDSYHLVFARNASPGSTQELKSFNLFELEKMKHISSREKDPVSGHLVKWEGVLLSQLIDRVMESMPLEDRAQVDLIVLKSNSGEAALIPRALVSKYPVMLAFDWGAYVQQRGVKPRGPIYSVVPWSSRPRILNEDLPLERFFVPQVVKIELTSYRDRYSSLFLKRRTDPSAMRGEKLFVQNCVCCHTLKPNSLIVGITEESKAKKFASQGHPAVNVSLKLSERDLRSVARYLDVYRSENPLSISQRADSIRGSHSN